MRPLALVPRVLILIVCLLIVQEPRLLAVPQAVARGEAALRQGQIADAIRAYRAALDAAPGDAYILTQLADSLLAVHRPDVAVLYLRQLAARHGWSPSLYREMGNALDAQGEHAQAIRYWNNSQTGSKQDIPVLRKLIDDAIQERDWRGAVAQLNRLIALDPRDAQASYQLGLLTVPVNPAAGAAYLQHATADPQYRNTVTAVSAALTAHGKESSTSVAFQVGMALMNQQVWAYAEHALIVALGQGVQNAEAMAFLGVVQDQQGRDGWTMIEKAYTAAPTDSLVNYAVALHLRLNGDNDQALAALVRAEALDPRNPAVAAEIGLVYQTENKPNLAAPWFNTAADLAPDSPGFRVLLAAFYADSGYNLQNEGLRVIRKLVDQAPDDPDIRASLGRALFLTGEVETARVELDHALVLDPANARSRYYYANLLEFRGDREGAIDAYLRVYGTPTNSGFRDLAAVALRRLGYTIDPNHVP